jgi:hypothetical protein
MDTSFFFFSKQSSLERHWIEQQKRYAAWSHLACQFWPRVALFLDSLALYRSFFGYLKEEAWAN